MRLIETNWPGWSEHGDALKCDVDALYRTTGFRFGLITHHKPKLIERRAPMRAAVRFLRSSMDTFKREPDEGVKLAKWINFQHRGGQLHPHDHSHVGADLSAVLFLSEGAPLFFAKRRRLVWPRPGRVVVFAASEWHMVPPQTRSEVRVSLNINRIPIRR